MVIITDAEYLCSNRTESYPTRHACVAICVMLMPVYMLLLHAMHKIPLPHDFATAPPGMSYPEPTGSRVSCLRNSIGAAQCHWH